jgi:hypothetical protein
MLISKWRNNEFRAQTTKELTPIEGNIEFKPREAEGYKVGDDVMVYGMKAKVTAVDGPNIEFKGDGGSGSINFERSPRSISKIETPKTEVDTELKELNTRKQSTSNLFADVKRAKNAGYSDAAIRQFFLNAGYTNQQITDALNQATNNNGPSGTSVKEIFYKSKKALEGKKKDNAAIRALRFFREKAFDRQAGIKRIINGISNEDARKAYNRLITKAGASGFAALRFKNAEKAIYGKLSKVEAETLDQIIYVRRIIAVNENRAKRGMNPYVGMNGYSEADARVDLENIKNEIGEEKFNKLNERATAYFDVFRENLDKLYKSGRINKETYDNLKDVEYSPIATIKYIIGDNTDPSEVDRQAARLGMAKADIKALTDKNENEIITDSRWLLMMNINAVEARAFENEMLNKFSDAINNATAEEKAAIADYVLDNPVVGQAASGAIQYKYNEFNTPRGYTAISFYKDGVKNNLIVKDEFATQLLDIKTKEQSLELLGKMSGANILRFFATGGNPLFIIGNTAVDFQNIAFFSDVYSKVKPLGMAQLGYDYVKNFTKKALMNDQMNKIYNEYMEHGGAMDYMALDGLKSLKELRPALKVAKGAQKVLLAYGRAMAYLGATSEVAFRLSVYEKVKNDLISKFEKENGTKPTGEDLDNIMYEATREARETIDFAQGGSWAKKADIVMPYFNASLQGFRRPMDYARNNPAGFASSMVQYGLMTGSLAAMSLAILMKALDDDDEEKDKVVDILNSVSEYEKANYHIIFTGKKDKDGNYEYYRIKKLPLLSVWGTQAEQIAYKYLLNSKGIKYDMDQAAVSKSLNLSLPMTLSDVKSRNPLISGLLTYNYNEDTFTGEKVFRGPKDKKIDPTAEGIFDDKVESIYKAIAPELGLSPVRMKAFMEKIITSETTNPTISLFYSAADGIFNKKDGFGKQFSNAINDVVESAERKTTRYTNKDILKYKLQDEQEAKEMLIETEIYKKEQKVYNEIESIYKNGDKMSNGELIEKVKENFDNKDLKKYVDKYHAYIKNMNVDKTILDIIYEDTPEVQALKLYNRYGDSFEQDELKELSSVMGAARRKISKKAMMIYNKKYKNR